MMMDAGRAGRAGRSSGSADGLTSGAPSGSSVLNDDHSSDDEAWLRTLCRADPAPAADSDEDAWVRELCRSPAPAPAVGGRGQDMAGTVHTRPGRAGSGSGTAEGLSPDLGPAHGASPTNPRGPASRRNELLGGPYTSQQELAAELLAAGLPEPPTCWPAPQQNTMLHTTQHQSFGPLAACLWRFAAWAASLQRVFAFKVGIAYEPAARWELYHDEETWLFMDVMHQGSPEECRRLEIALIRRLRTFPGCQNIAPGGEGIRAGTTDGTCYCYAVYAPAGDGVGLRQAWIARQRTLARACFPRPGRRESRPCARARARTRAGASATMRTRSRTRDG